MTQMASVAATAAAVLQHVHKLIPNSGHVVLVDGIETSTLTHGFTGTTARQQPPMLWYGGRAETHFPSHGEELLCTRYLGGTFTGGSVGLAV